MPLDAAFGSAVDAESGSAVPEALTFEIGAGRVAEIQTCEHSVAHRQPPLGTQQQRCAGCFRGAIRTRHSRRVNGDQINKSLIAKRLKAKPI